MEELKVTFYLKKNEERADGMVPIFCLLYTSDAADEL